jgi:hypothetical protein
MTCAGRSAKVAGTSGAYAAVHACGARKPRLVLPAVIAARCVRGTPAQSPRGIAVPSMASTWLTRSVAPIGPYLRAESRWFDNQTTRSSDTATCRRSLGSVRPDHDNLLSHVSWVCLERGGGRIRSAVEAATKRRLGYGFHMSGAPTDAGRDSLLHHSLNRLAAPDAGRWSLRPGHGQ